jgi:integrase/recombinase XerD
MRQTDGARLQQRVDAFLTHLSAHGTTPAGTLKAYRTDLAQSVAFLAERGITNIEQLCSSDLHAYRAWLDTRGYATATIARRIVALRAFILFLVQSGALTSDLCTDLPPPLVTRRPRRVLTSAQIERLRALMLREGTADGWRDRAILEVLLATALRASELMALNLADVDLDGATITLHAGGRQARTLALEPETVMALAAYIQVGRPKLLRGQSDAGALFLNQQGERLTRQGCWAMLKTYARTLDLSDLSPELVRQSVATLRFAEGASVGEVQALLGHAAGKTTVVYRPRAVTQA